jgi:hypothetical protein
MFFSLLANAFVRPKIIVKTLGQKEFRATFWHKLAFALDIIAIGALILLGYSGLKQDFLHSHYFSKILAWSLIGSGCAYFIACLIWTYHLISSPKFPRNLYCYHLPESAPLYPSAESGEDQSIAAAQDPNRRPRARIAEISEPS